MAIIAHPEDGSHHSAAEMLDDLADGIGRIIDEGLLVAPDGCEVPEALMRIDDSDGRENDEPVDLS